MNQYRFELKHLLGLFIAILISTLIFLFSNEIRKLGELGYVGVFFFMLLNNATLFVPSPGLVFVFVLGNTLPNPLFTGVAAGLGSIVGEMVGYFAGSSGKGFVSDTSSYHRIKNFVSKYGLGAIFLFALIPNPLFDVVGLIAGILGIKWWKFFLVAGTSMILKATVVASLGAYFIK